MFGFDQKNNLILENYNLCFRHNYFLDFDEYSLNLQPFSGETLPLSPGKFESYISHITTKNIKILFQQHSSLTLYKGACLDRVAFGISAFHQGNLLQHTYKVGKDSILVFYPNQEISGFQQKFHSSYVIFFENQFMTDCCKILGLFELKEQLEHKKIHPIVTTSYTDKVKYIRELCNQIYQLLFNLTTSSSQTEKKILATKYIKQQLEEEIALTLLTTLAEVRDIQVKKVYLKRASILKKAEDLFLSNLTIDITTQTICKELRVSQRTLEYIFKDFYGISPKNYFKRLRLNALYKELQRQDDKINLTEIAYKFGFFHRGQLANDYQKFFGELPSETLRGKIS
ncbi:MAG: helix-turn-helix domain-containing protein [Crocosphaera sp.]|nr:helix-turn-helix domain-containing protein [Crocosphaera sp.]